MQTLVMVASGEVQVYGDIGHRSLQVYGAGVVRPAHMYLNGTPEINRGSTVERYLRSFNWKMASVDDATRHLAKPSFRLVIPPKMKVLVVLDGKKMISLEKTESDWREFIRHPDQSDTEQRVKIGQYDLLVRPL